MGKRNEHVSDRNQVPRTCLVEHIFDLDVGIGGVRKPLVDRLQKGIPVELHWLEIFFRIQPHVNNQVQLLHADQWLVIGTRRIQRSMRNLETIDMQIGEALQF